MLTEIRQQTLDIDWFFVSDNAIGCVASGGGKLPESVAFLNDEIWTITSYFRNLPEKTSIIINEELEKIKGAALTDNYLSDFVYMAKRGLFAFDKSNLNNFLDSKYHLVTRPVEPIELEKLSVEIQELINKTNYKGNIRQVDFVDVEDIN